MAGGRPPRFETPEQLEQLVDEYFASCDPHIVKVKVKRLKEDDSHYWAETEEMSQPKPKTITGLAQFLEVDRKTLFNYETDRPEFFPTITRAKTICEAYAEAQLFVGRNANGASFSLKNNYGWIDKSVVDNTNRNVKDELDEIDDQKAEVAAGAKEAIDGPPAKE